MKKLRLLKVIVQPTFVVDDGENLNEIVTEPVTVPAAEWPTYAVEGFAKAVNELEEQLRASEQNKGVK